MRAFSCPTCGQLVFFENTRCLNCGTPLGLDPEGRELVRAGTYCANAEIAGCNWLVEMLGELCASCRLTLTRPADSDTPGLEAFRTAEAAKRRLLVNGPVVSHPADADGPPEMIAAWLPLSYALNRSMGRDDIYPLVLPPAVIDKLAMVHQLVGSR